MGCNDKSRVNDPIRTGNVGLDSLVRIYTSHNKDLAAANMVSQSNVDSFKNPLVLSTAVLMARRYKTMLDALQHIVGSVVSDFIAQKLDVNDKLNALLSVNTAGTNLINKAKSKSRSGKK